MNHAVQYRLGGDTARAIARSVEDSIRQGDLAPGDGLPTVRGLATDLGVSPSTVANAYRELQRRGVLVGSGRRGTHVRRQPPVSSRLPMAVPPGVRDLRTGGPDPDLLPPLPWPARPAPRGYGDPAVSPRLAEVAGTELEADGIDGSALAVVGGALDGVERVLGAWLHPGDRVVVEDPGYTASLDLLVALGMEVVPVGMDERGIRPDRLDAALARGADAVLLTPRAQNPTGTAWDGAGSPNWRPSCPGTRTSWSSRTTTPARPRAPPPTRCAGPASAGPRSARCPSGSAPTSGWPSWPVTRRP